MMPPGEREIKAIASNAEYATIIFAVAVNILAEQPMDPIVPLVMLIPDTVQIHP